MQGFLNISFPFYKLTVSEEKQRLYGAEGSSEKRGHQWLLHLALSGQLSPRTLLSNCTEPLETQIQYSVHIAQIKVLHLKTQSLLGLFKSIWCKFFVTFIWQLWSNLMVPWITPTSQTIGPNACKSYHSLCVKSCLLPCQSKWLFRNDHCRSLSFVL